MTVKTVLCINLFLLMTTSARAGIVFSQLKSEAISDTNVEISLTPAEYQVISLEIDGIVLPVRELSEGRYITRVFGRGDTNSKLKIFYFIKDQLPVEDITIRFVKSSDTGKSESPPFPESKKLAGLSPLALDLLPLQGLTDTLLDAVVGRSDTHRIGLDISANQIPGNGQIWITFEAGFDVGGVLLDSIRYSDDDPANDGSEPVFDSLDVITRTIILGLDNGTPAAQNSRINVEIKSVNNSQIAADYSVIVQTFDSLGVMIHAPTASAPFTLYPDTLASVTIAPDSNLTVTSDSILTFAATGQDSYGNYISGLTFDWAGNVDSCGSVVAGVFRSNKAGQCYVTATSGACTDSSGLITVTPGALSRFALSGYPSSRTAGQAFSNPVSVTLYDINENVIYDANDSLYFASDDDSASFTYDSSNRLVIDTGQVSIPGASFTLKQSGTKHLVVTNGVVFDTSEAIQVNASTIRSINIYTYSPLYAGMPFLLYVNNARDLYGNPASGNVNVGIIGAGNDAAPDGSYPVLNYIPVYNGSGSATQIIFRTGISRFIGSPSDYSVFRDTTADLTVNPSFDLGGIGFTGYPDTLTAGGTFPDNPVVTLYDLYSNIKTNYQGTVTFTHTFGDSVPDSIYIDSSHQGVDTIPGDYFQLTTAGLGRVTVVESSSGTMTQSDPIQVFPGEIASYSLGPIAAVNVGVPFAISIADAFDAYGNDATGVIHIDSIGQASSPGGDLPVLNDITVVNGAGSANQALVRALPAVQLQATYGAVVESTNAFIVNPGALGELEVAIASPQIADRTFTSPSTITAKDYYGNIKTDFNALFDNILITASTGGPMTNGTLNQTAHFTDGIADLTITGRDTRYNGYGGQVVFTATSQSGVSGESNAVQISSVEILSLDLDNLHVLNGDTATGEFRISNYGSIDYNLTLVGFYAGNIAQSSVCSPPLPRVIPATGEAAIIFALAVNTGGPGIFPVRIVVAGNYAGLLAFDILDNADTLIVTTASDVVDIPGSLAPVTTSCGYDYSFTFDLTNLGGAAFYLADSSYITFTDGSAEYRAELGQNSFIDPGDTTTLAFESAEILSAFVPNSYNVDFQIYGYDLSGNIVDLLTLADTVLVQSAPDIVYESNLTPVQLTAGSDIAFSARVINNGQAGLTINHNSTRIAFSDGAHQFTAYIDTLPGVRVDQIEGGSDTTLTFTAAQLLPSFAAGDYVPVIALAGSHNQRSYAANIPVDTVTVMTAGRIRLDSLYLDAYNRPRVNVNQSFVIHGYISNLGDETIDSVRLLLTTDGNSDIIGDSGDTLDIGTVGSMSGEAFNCQIDAAANPNPLETFTCAIVKAVGHASGNDTPVAAPLDNSAAAIIESEVEFWIDTLYLADDTVSTNQVFTVYARVGHSGGTSYDGTNQLTINFGGDAGFVVADSINRNFIAGQLLTWNITAPSTTRNGALVNVLFNGPYIDLNDSSTALGTDSLLTATVIVTPEATISHTACILSPAGATDSILSTGQTFIVADSLFPAGNTADSYARLILPSGFSSTDPLTIPLSGARISWHIRAADQPVSDSLRFECWSFDANTGDSVYDDAIYLPVEIIERATLALSCDITAPVSAIDRIVSPGDTFTLSAAVTNSGEAATGDGQLTLQVNSPDFLVAEPVSRTCTPGSPVDWHIISPAAEIPAGIPISVILSSIPVDNNSNNQALVLSDSSGIIIIVREEMPQTLLMPELVVHDPTPIGRAAVAGQPIDIYSLYLENSDNGSTQNIGLYSLNFRLKASNANISPPDVLSASTMRINDAVYYGTFDDSLVNFNFNPAIFIAPDSSRSLVLNVTPSANPVYNSFYVNFTSNDFAARAVIAGAAGDSVEVVLTDGGSFSLDGLPLVVLADDFVTSAKVNQNPYRASEGNLEIGFNLENDATIELAIYNLYGDAVWKFAANPANGYGTSGEHYNQAAVTWDGRDSGGGRVLSGVYYILLRNITSGQSTKMKVVVLW